MRQAGSPVLRFVMRAADARAMLGLVRVVSGPGAKWED